MKLKFKNQPFQQIAVDAVADLFLGQKLQQFALQDRYQSYDGYGVYAYNLGSINRLN